MKIKESRWITVSQDIGDVCPVFLRRFPVERPVRRAELQISALGVYEAELNGSRVGDYVLAPGWTSYDSRLQVQSYDVTGQIQDENELQVTIGRGWFRSPMPGWMDSEDKKRRYNRPCGVIARLELQYADGTGEVISTDETWQWAESPVRFSEIYDGEIYDASFDVRARHSVVMLEWPREILIPQEGEIIRETERVAAKRILHTPAGETVIDFGQEVTGYVEFHAEAGEGDIVQFDHGEVLDRNGNFYKGNYRSAKAMVTYICRNGRQSWHPKLTFFGFRYIRLLAWPGEVLPENFTAVVVHSDMRRTGWITSGSAELNRLISNIVWGQRGNFLDVPTDCPQRDERLGWTGDAQVFVRAAGYLYDVERFFRKWLRDLAADQRDSGEVGQVIPDYMPEESGSAAWGDAATICPWQIFQMFGDSAVLEEQYESMKKWVDYITSVTETPDLWTGHFHFGDWLGLDAPEGSYKGSTREDFIATAFYARSTEILVKTGRVLGRDVVAYEMQYERIVSAFRAAYPIYRTQTEYALAAYFHLAENPQKTADELADMVRSDGTQLRTGFVGTPYILHVLSSFGYSNLAWSLLLRREYPGWLYPVRRGATTIWEHWDGIRADGSFWSEDMNSFNHYAYGAVADWLFEQAAGIRHDEDHPGFSELIYDPKPDIRLGWLRVKVDTRRGPVAAGWNWEKEGIRYELETPVPAWVCLHGEKKRVDPGSYIFWGECPERKGNG